MLKITMKPIEDSPPFINVGQNVKVVDLETGVDLSKGVRNITVYIRKDEWVTAVLECEVGELDLVGVERIPKEK